MYKLLTRSELYEMVWEQPVTKVATELEISDVAVAKICRKYNIPVPGRGYWAKVAAGKRVRQITLPKTDDPYPQEIEIHGSAMRKYSERVLVAHGQSSASEVQANPNEPDQETDEPVKSPYLDKLKKQLGSAKPKRDGFIKISNKQQFAINITPSCSDKARQTLENVVKETLTRGFQLKPTDNGLAIQFGEDLIAFSLTEKLERIPHEPTDSENAKLERWQSSYQRKINAGQYASTWDKPEIPEFDYIPSGHLMIEIDDGSHYDGIRRKFSDGKKQRIENMAERIVTAIAVCAAAAVERREEAARREREWALWEIQRKEQERKQILEKKRWEFLEKKIQCLEKALVLEKFVSDYEKNFDSSDLPVSCQQLIQWASIQAESIRSTITPTKLAATLDKYQLMDDKTEINSWTQISDTDKNPFNI